jgi:hypothetical protein
LAAGARRLITLDCSTSLRFGVGRPFFSAIVA